MDSLFLNIVLFSLLVFARGSIYKNLKHFETVHADDITHKIVKRGIAESSHPFNKIKEVNFNTLGRDFRLILTPKRSVLHSKFKAYAVDGDGKETSVHIDHDDFYDGRVFGETVSHVSLHMEDGVMTGSIHLPDEIYHVEPSWRHLSHLDNRTMVVYRQSDVKFSWDRENLPPGQVGPRICGYVKEGEELDSDEDEFEEQHQWTSQHHRNKRQVDQYEYTPTKTRCPLLLVADYRFFQEMGASNTKTTINYLV
jgi:disintegrin and metalloproteinase domain-containing protein 17